jgi:hypothetical protein
MPTKYTKKANPNSSAPLWLRSLFFNNLNELLDRIAIVIFLLLFHLFLGHISDDVVFIPLFLFRAHDLLEVPVSVFAQVLQQ